MALIKCPRCELNYMQTTDKLCAVCKREIRGEDEHLWQDLCANCGENPPAPGEEFCPLCLKELARGEDLVIGDDDAPEEAVLGLSGASEMEEIEVDVGVQTIPRGEFKVIKDELGGDEEEEDIQESDEPSQDMQSEDEAIESLDELSELEFEMDDEDED